MALEKFENLCEYMLNSHGSIANSKRNAIRNYAKIFFATNATEAKADYSDAIDDNKLRE